MNFVFTLGVEAAQAIEASQPGAGVSGFGVNRHRTERYDVTIHDFELRWISVFDAREFEDVAEAAVVARRIGQSPDRPSAHKACWPSLFSSTARCAGRNPGCGNIK